MPTSSARLALKVEKTDFEESQVRRHKRFLQQMNPAGNILPTPTAVLSMASLPLGRQVGNRRRMQELL